MPNRLYQPENISSDRSTIPANGGFLKLCETISITPPTFELVDWGISGPMRVGATHTIEITVKNSGDLGQQVTVGFEVANSVDNKVLDISAGGTKTAQFEWTPDKFESGTQTLCVTVGISEDIRDCQQITIQEAAQGAVKAVVQVNDPDNIAQGEVDVLLRKTTVGFDEVVASERLNPPGQITLADTPVGDCADYSVKVEGTTVNNRTISNTSGVRELCRDTSTQFGFVLESRDIVCPSLSINVDGQCVSLVEVGAIAGAGLVSLIILDRIIIGN